MAQTASRQNLDIEQEHRIALCLGAHRSGTSLIAAAFEALGARLALPEHEASDENLKGFFEHGDIVALDDRLLQLAGSAWDDPGFDGQALLELSADTRSALEQTAGDILRQDLLKAQLSAVKDPRMCRLLPFWFPTLRAAGYRDESVRCVLVTRDPVEVAISQRTRCRKSPDYYEFGENLAEGAALWLGHIRPILRDCLGRELLVLSYRDFLERPAELFEALGAFLEIAPDPVRIARFADEFIDASLWRSHVDDMAVAEVEEAFPGLRAAEQCLAALSGRVVGEAELSPILQELDQPAFGKSLSRITARAYGRLSARRRDERMEALRTENALQVTRAARDEFARSRDSVAAAAAKVEGGLRENLTRLNEGLAARDREIADRGRELREAAERHNRALAEAEVARAAMQVRMDELQKVSDYLQQSMGAMLSSRSWRLTYPLRKAGTMARDAKRLPAIGLRKLNRASQVAHQRLKRSHPETAELLRRNIQPLMMRANMKLLGQYNPAQEIAMREAEPSAVLSSNSIFEYQQTREFPPFAPLVTIIVPNYNHARYLEKRLDSIYAQTYQNYEVLLLDDCSSDESREVLNRFAEKFPDRTRTLFNEANSGGVFFQWEKGLAAARGDLIWIAESDDWASPNFLESLVPYFQNEAVQLAYARTIFMDGAGENQIWSMEEYLAQFGGERWGRSWVETAANIVRDVFSMTNIVPNVSSAVFRRFDRLEALEIDSWRGMRTCGDWMFYLNAIRGGMMAYTPDAQNFYRIHESNTSVTSHKADKFYREHEEVAKCLRRHYRVPAENLVRMESNLRHHWKITRGDYSDEAFNTCFDAARIQVEQTRKPGILMAGYAFCAGGGETFPIQLANELKLTGYEVTFLDCAREERVEGIRAMLATDIPVISDFTHLRRIVQDFDIELVHSHHGWVDNTVLDLLPPNSPTQTVVTLHGFYETVPEAQLKVLLPRLINRSGGLVYTAGKNLDAIRQAGLIDVREIHRIDNALSKSDVKPLDRATLGIPNEAFVLTLVSRALHSKGWLEAIASVGRAREISGRDIHLILIGEGEAKDAAEEAGIPGHVHLQGFRQNIRDYFAASDLGFLPSRFPGESFPLVVIDSLLAGTPVLASDIGEIRYMLSTNEGPAGALFSLDEEWRIDTEGLAQLIADLASEPGEIQRLKARVSTAVDRFDPQRMADNYDSVYRRVTAKGGQIS
ncbi:glycosyltransferase [Paracoccus sp. CPCC 101403]|uniref:Glycosyltransferase n=1 Tax=Paracoccus broussonetiae TaxID=3075834 RepID=A0ABU3ECT8_9RHOB|nr:glycosyltransferase [Paracoccus sp. CPCC 101403]MDT1062037.1 glycosyltransferase [Paracoccus sp. CPCC 101403]